MSSPTKPTRPGVEETAEAWRNYDDRVEEYYAALVKAADERTQAAEQRAQAPVPAEKPRDSKAFIIRTIGKDPTKYSGGKYHLFERYIQDMERNFTLNEVDTHATKPNEKKVLYAEGFLISTAYNNWTTEKKSNKDKEYTWKEYKDFLAKHVDRAETLHEDTYKKWKNCKQEGESVRDFNTRRLGYLSILSSGNFMPTPDQELTEFYNALRDTHQEKLSSQSIWKDKEELIERVRRMEDFEDQKKEGSKKRKKHTRDLSSSDSGSDDKAPKNKSKGKGQGKDKSDKKGRDKKPRRSDNPNKDPIGEKLWRWTKKEFDDILHRKACTGCGKDGHSIADCKNVKNSKYSKDVAFETKN